LRGEHARVYAALAKLGLRLGAQCAEATEAIASYLRDKLSASTGLAEEERRLREASPSGASATMEAR